MRRALPTIAVSAAGVTWLLHAQGVIDATVAPTGSTGSTDASTATAPAPTTPTSRPTPTTTPTTTAGRPGRGAPSTTAPAAPTTTAPAGGATTATRTVTGPVIGTEFGPLQVSIVVSGDSFTDVRTLQSPSSARRSQQINNRALPILRQEAVAAQSSDLDSVSGATVTSDAYETSLQAALDTAGLDR